MYILRNTPPLEGTPSYVINLAHRETTEYGVVTSYLRRPIQRRHGLIAREDGSTKYVKKGIFRLKYICNVI